MNVEVLEGLNPEFLTLCVAGLINFEGLEEQYDLIHYHWCVMWRERKHWIFPRLIKMLCKRIKLGYRHIGQGLLNCVHVISALFTLALSLSAGSVAYVWLIDQVCTIK